ncbi:MAG: TlpA disulfide reductase family protein [Pseudoxanthomonas sp.]
MTANRLGVLLAVALGIVCLSNARAAEPTPEDSIRQGMHLEDYKVLKFNDANGASITASEFMSLASTGHSFSIAKDTTESLATLSINPPAKKSAPDVAPAPSNAGLKILIGEKIPAPPAPALIGVAAKRQPMTGRPVLISFFFHDCIPCIQEIPALNAFADQNPDVSILAVTFESKDEASRFVSKYGLKWPVSVDAEDFVEDLGVKTYPTLALVSADGKLLGARTGNLASANDASDGSSVLQAWVSTFLK